VSAPDVPPLPRASPPGSSNALGLAGFIVSLVGLVLTCGVLCPVGFVLSALGLRKEPRGLAIAGVAIGAVGTLLAVAAAIFVVKSLHLLGRTAGDGAFEFEGPRVSTEITLSMAEELIDLENAEKGRLPAEADGTALLASMTDGWGRALRYERGADDGYTIRSAGPDGAFGTGDDVTTTR
jgi:hypothetical protein